MLRFLTVFLLGLILVGCSATNVGAPPSEDAPSDGATSELPRVPLLEGPLGGVGSGRLIVVLHEDVVSSASSFASIASVAGAELVDSFDSLGILVLEAPPVQLSSVVDGLVADARVKSVELSQPVVLWNGGEGWHLDRVNQRALPLDSRLLVDPSAGAGVRVYVMDSGVNGNHPSLRGRVLPGVDLSAGDGQRGPNGLNDCEAGHGTSVASLVAGIGFGAAPAATVVPVKSFSCDGVPSYVETILEGFEWIFVDAGTWDGPKILNMSFGASYSAALNAGVDRLANAGILPVAAAGNAKQDACTSSPASAPSTLTVGASALTLVGSRQEDRAASFSAFGRCVAVMAPGVDVVAASRDFGGSNSGKQLMSGTSFAAPFVAGLAARYWSEFPDASPVEVGLHVIDSSTPNQVLRMQSGNVWSEPRNLAYQPLTLVRGEDGLPGDFKCVYCFSATHVSDLVTFNIRTWVTTFDLPAGRTARITMNEPDPGAGVGRITTYLEVWRDRMWWQVAYYDVRGHGFTIDVPAKNRFYTHRLVMRMEEETGTTLVITDTTHGIP